MKDFTNYGIKWIRQPPPPQKSEVLYYSGISMGSFWTHEDLTRMLVLPAMYPTIELTKKYIDRFSQEIGVPVSQFSIVKITVHPVEIEDLEKPE